jgi:hypothetical protein
LPETLPSAGGWGTKAASVLHRYAVCFVKLGKKCGVRGEQLVGKVVRHRRGADPRMRHDRLDDEIAVSA